MNTAELPEPKEFHATLKGDTPVPVKPDAEMTNGSVTLNALNLNSWVYVALNEIGWELFGNYTHKAMDYRVDIAAEAVSRARDKMELFKCGDTEYRLFKIQLHALIRAFGEMGVCANSNPFDGCQIFFDRDDIITDPGSNLGATTHSADADAHEPAIAKVSPREFPLDLGRHAAKVRADELSLRADLPDDTCEERKLPKETPMIRADELLAKQKELAETVEAEANSKVYDEVLPILYSDVTQYAMSHLTAREIRYDIRHGNVIRHDGTGDSVMFTLVLMSRVCDALGKFGYDANCSYDKTECNGTFTIKWGVKK